MTIPPASTVTVTGDPQRVIVRDGSNQVVVAGDTYTVTVLAPGPQGPPGPAGPGGGSYYFHTQAAPSAGWIIDHDLGRPTHCTIFQSGEEVEADVVRNTDDQTTITFPAPTTGEALIS